MTASNRLTVLSIWTMPPSFAIRWAWTSVSCFTMFVDPLLLQLQPRDEQLGSDACARRPIDVCVQAAHLDQQRFERRGGHGRRRLRQDDRADRDYSDENSGEPMTHRHRASSFR